MCRNEMICIVLILLMSVSYAVSDRCVTYTFEQNYEEWLTNDWGRRDCFPYPSWIENKYSNIDLSAKNDQSTTFISPTPGSYSCVSSFNFNMHFNGKIEVNYYIEKDEKLWNFIDVYVQTVEGNLLGYERNEVTLPNFKSGWHTFTIPLTREGSYEGYISIMGFAAAGTIVLVDSFRYIPPDMDEKECRLYEDKTTTEDTSTDETSTQETSTDETSTDETSTDEIRTEETGTDETSTSETTTTEPTTSGSTTPEPTTLAPVDMEDSKGFWAPFTFNFSFNFTTFLRT